MIGQIRNSKFIRIFCGLMGLYMLNISIDTADPNPEHIPEDLSFNDYESIIEIVVEKILGYENAIEEYDDNDTEDYSKKSNTKIDLSIYLMLGSNTSQSTFGIKKQSFPDIETHLTNGFHQLITPPPRF